MRAIGGFVIERIGLAVLASVALAALPFAAGGGAYVRHLAILLAPLCVAASIGLAILVGFRRPRNPWFTDAAVGWMAATLALPAVVAGLSAGRSLGEDLRGVTALQVARRCDRLLDSLDRTRATMGWYPDRWPAGVEARVIRLVPVPELRPIQVRDLSGADAVIYVSSARYFAVIPIERPDEIITSWTTSLAWLRSDEDPTWREERLYWMLTVRRHSR